METQKFIRIPLEIEAVQVTPTNVAEVAKWCKGTVTQADYRLMGGNHKMGAILLPKQGPKSDKTRLVLIGSWITHHKNTFRAWTLEAFEASYTQVLKNGDIVRANNEIWEGWEGKVEDAHLVGVSFGTRGMFVFQPDQITKIAEMDSAQLEANAGVEMDAEAEGKDVFAGMLDQMRDEAKDRIAALEAENLEYDDVIRVGDLVKVVPDDLHNEHSVKFVGQCGHVIKINDDGLSKVEFATDDPEKPEIVTFVTDTLEKLRQDGETLNLEGWESSDLDRLNAEKLEESVVAINDLREDLGMPRVPELEGVAADPRTIETHKQITDLLAQEDQDKVEEIKTQTAKLQAMLSQKLAEGEVHFHDVADSKVQLEDFAQNDRVRILKNDDRNGSIATVTVVGVEIEGLPLIEVNFSESTTDPDQYGIYAPSELEKI